MMHCYAGHGMNKDGRQVLLINQYDPKGKFYYTAAAETEIRDMAKLYRMSYHFCVFACCREIFLKSKHTNGLSTKRVNEILNYISCPMMEKIKILLQDNYKERLK